MSRIFVSITHTSRVNLITEAHRSFFPNECHNSERLAYDWQVCQKRKTDKVNNVLSGSCEWQCCGYDEYAIDLPNNLIAGMVAYEISRDYDRFFPNPSQWLNDLTSKKDLKDIELVFENDRA